MAMAVVTVGMTVLMLLGIEVLNSKRKWNAS
jgi:iron(III) transport system permease protein